MAVHACLERVHLILWPPSLLRNDFLAFPAIPTCWNLTKENKNLKPSRRIKAICPITPPSQHPKNAYKCVILRGEHGKLRATPKEEQCSHPPFQKFHRAVGTRSREWCMVNSALGRYERGSRKKIRERAFYLRCLLFPGLFLDVILCRLC